MECRRGTSSDESSVCLSVCLSVCRFYQREGDVRVASTSLPGHLARLRSVNGHCQSHIGRDNWFTISS